MDKQETLEITVSETTAEELRNAAKETGMSIGQIVDELALEIAPNDPRTATILALRNACAILSYLDYEDYQKAYFDLTVAFMAYYPPKAFSELVAEAKIQHKRALTEKSIPALTEEEMQDLLNLLKKFRSKKNTRK